MEIIVDNSQERTVKTMRRDEVGIMHDKSVIFHKKDTIHNTYGYDMWVIFKTDGRIEVYKNDYLPNHVAIQKVELLIPGTTVSIKL